MNLEQSFLSRNRKNLNLTEQFSGGVIVGIQKEKKNINPQWLVYIVLFVAAFIFMLWKVPYGFGGSDEAFYLTVPYRLTLGDKLFLDEWHLSQLSSFLTLPFVALYTHFVGSAEGIILAARYVYAVLHALCAFIIYLRLRKYGAFACAASILYMLFTPFDMMCYSYNTLALDTLALAGVLTGTAGNDSRADYVLAGVFFACTVVCCPYMAVVYFLFFVLTAVYSVIGKKGKKEFNNNIFSWHVFWRVTLGVLITSVFFAVFFFKHSDIKSLINSLPGLFSDPEHPSYSLLFMLKHYMYCLVTAHRLIILPLALYSAALVFLAFDKRRKQHAVLHLALSALCTVGCYAMFCGQLTDTYYNGIMLPLAFVGFTAYLLLDNKPRELFTTVFALGVAYSMCVSATSNMGFNVMSMAFSVVNIASVVFIAMLIERSKDTAWRHTTLRTALILPVICLAALTIFVKAEHCFWDGSPSQLDNVIYRGPARGIVTSERLCSDYTRVYDDMQEYAGKSGGTLLIYAQQTWCTLSMPQGYECASFSAWLSGQDEVTEERLALYYTINPDKAPDYVYILKNNAFSQPNLDGERIYKDADKYGFSVMENDISWKLEKTEQQN